MRRSTRAVLAVAGAVIAAALALALPVAADESAPSPAFLRAHVSTAGPYGESWYVTLTPDGDLHLQVFYGGSPSGTVLGRLMLGEAHVHGVVDALAASAFHSLPSEIAPAQRAFHRPNLQVEVFGAGGHHKVTVYDPAAVEDRAAVDRFLAVWHRIFDGLPFRPSIASKLDD